jgi:hypothetical protein
MPGGLGGGRREALPYPDQCQSAGRLCRAYDESSYFLPPRSRYQPQLARWTPSHHSLSSPSGTQLANSIRTLVASPCWWLKIGTGRVGPGVQVVGQVELTLVQQALGLGRHGPPAEVLWASLALLSPAMVLCEPGTMVRPVAPGTLGSSANGLMPRAMPDSQVFVPSAIWWFAPPVMATRLPPDVPAGLPPCASAPVAGTAISKAANSVKCEVVVMIQRLSEGIVG